MFREPGIVVRGPAGLMGTRPRCPKTAQLDNGSQHNLFRYKSCIRHLISGKTFDRGTTAPGQLPNIGIN